MKKINYFFKREKLAAGMIPSMNKNLSLLAIILQSPALFSIVFGQTKQPIYTHPCRKDRIVLSWQEVM